MFRFTLLAISALLVCTCVKAAAVNKPHRLASSSALSASPIGNELVEEDYQQRLEQLEQEKLGQQAAEVPVMPLGLFPVLQPYQRCLFVCQYCYVNKDSSLLHCANDWCLRRVQKMHKLPERAFKECPAMKLVNLAGRPAIGA